MLCTNDNYSQKRNLQKANNYKKTFEKNIFMWKNLMKNV